ncbi:spermatogenesis-associated protein 13 [Nowakowskiella sp. JEL0407]|nr:spermatogenesis-associated protein 13 [Nowakowskiella sp. JEL0407]
MEIEQQTNFITASADGNTATSLNPGPKEKWKVKTQLSEVGKLLKPKVIQWIKNQIALIEGASTLTDDEFFEELRKGRILCKILTALNPAASIPPTPALTDDIEITKFNSIEALNCFLQGMIQFGVEKKYSFRPLELCNAASSKADEIFIRFLAIAALVACENGKIVEGIQYEELRELVEYSIGGILELKDTMTTEDDISMQKIGQRIANLEKNQSRLFQITSESALKIEYQSHSLKKLEENMETVLKNLDLISKKFTEFELEGPIRSRTHTRSSSARDPGTDEEDDDDVSTTSSLRTGKSMSTYSTRKLTFDMRGASEVSIDVALQGRPLSGESPSTQPSTPKSFSKLPKELLDANLPKSELMRLSVVYELIETEADYIRDLNVMINVLSLSKYNYELIKFTDQASTEHANLLKAAQSIEAVVAKVNEATRALGEREKIIALQSKIDGASNLNLENKKLMKEGMVMKIQTGMRSKEKYLVLFSDLMLMCKPGKSRYQLEMVIPMIEIIVKAEIKNGDFNIRSIPKTAFQLLLIGGKEPIIISCSDDNEKLKWVEAFQEAHRKTIEEQRKIGASVSFLHQDSKQFGENSIGGLVQDFGTVRRSVQNRTSSIGTSGFKRGKWGSIKRAGKMVDTGSDGPDANSQSAGALEVEPEIEEPEMVEIAGQIWKKTQSACNPNTLETMWKIPDIGVILLDPATGKPYEAEPDEDEEDIPSESIENFPDWRKVDLGDGSPYYFNVHTMETTWFPPGESPTTETMSS